MGKNEYLLKAGDNFLVYPNVVTHFYPDRDDPWHYTWVCFIGSRAEFFISKAGFELEKPILRLTSRDIIEDCFLKMMLANQLKKGKETYLLGQLHLLLTQFIEGADIPSHYNSSSSTQTGYISTAIDFMMTNYSKRINITEVASHVRISHKHLCKIFKLQLSISPHEFLTKIRMQKAIELLSQPSLAVGDISRSIGYEDPLLFSRMFKRYHGYCPREYRKRSLSNT